MTNIDLSKIMKPLKCPSHMMGDTIVRNTYNMVGGMKVKTKFYLFIFLSIINLALLSVLSFVTFKSSKESSDLLKGLLLGTSYLTTVYALYQGISSGMGSDTNSQWAIIITALLQLTTLVVIRPNKELAGGANVLYHMTLYLTVFQCGFGVFSVPRISEKADEFDEGSFMKKRIHKGRIATGKKEERVLKRRKSKGIEIGTGSPN